MLFKRLTSVSIAVITATALIGSNASAAASEWLSSCARALMSRIVEPEMPKDDPRVANLGLNQSHFIVGFVKRPQERFHVLVGTEVPVQLEFAFDRPSEIRWKRRSQIEKSWGGMFGRPTGDVDHVPKDKLEHAKQIRRRVQRLYPEAKTIEISYAGLVGSFMVEEWIPVRRDSGTINYAKAEATFEFSVEDGKFVITRLKSRSFALMFLFQPLYGHEKGQFVNFQLPPSTMPISVEIDDNFRLLQNIQDASLLNSHLREGFNSDVVRAHWAQFQAALGETVRDILKGRRQI